MQLEYEEAWEEARYEKNPPADKAIVLENDADKNKANRLSKVISAYQYIYRYQGLPPDPDTTSPGPSLKKLLEEDTLMPRLYKLRAYFTLAMCDERMSPDIDKEGKEKVPIDKDCETQSLRYRHDWLAKAQVEWTACRSLYEQEDKDNQMVLMALHDHITKSMAETNDRLAAL